MKRFGLIVCLSIFYVHVAYGQVKNDSLNLDTLIHQKLNTANDSLKIRNCKVCIPKTIRTLIKEKDGNIGMAGLFIPYKKRDFGYFFFLPKRKLMYVIKQDSICAIIYRTGGRGLNTTLLYVIMSSDKDKILSYSFYSVSNRIKRIDQFLEAIENTKYYKLEKDG